MAENKEVKIPMIKVVANDSISPVPKTLRIIATSKWVTFASMMEGNAFLKPTSIEPDKSMPRYCSSRILSKINIFASTAVPIVNTIPAIPAKVNTAPKDAKKPKIKITFTVNAIFAAKPDFP